MNWLTALLILTVSVIGMEAFAWIVHKFIMHGRLGWRWHESHHIETKGPFEKNDLYTICFSFIAATLFIIGSMGHPVIWMVALGLTVYGVLYGIVHDGLVHRRWPVYIRTPNGYLKRLVQAHRLHHAVHTREGAVSYGFLYAQDIRKLKAQLKKTHTPKDSMQNGNHD